MQSEHILSLRARHLVVSRLQRADAWVCRCLVLCKSLGILATAHADGKLFLRLLPRLQAGEGPTVTAGEPVQTLTKDPTALIQVWCNTHACALGHFWHLCCLGTSDIQHPISRSSSLE